MDFTYLLRPKKFDDILAQEHLVSKDAPLRVLVQKKALGHTFFYGEAGVGKTSLARVIALEMELPFYEFNATSLKIEELRRVFIKYKNTLQKPLIFIDEVHRLSKNQQEVLLPIMENNIAIILGASTQNPFFALTSAIRSRALLFELKSFDKNSLLTLLNRVLEIVEFKIDDDAKRYMIYSSGGDARAMLKLLEYALEIDNHITLKCLKSLRKNSMQVGSSEDGLHYDLTSALIKSMRGSDVDASLYYLARIIDSGESDEFIARRLVIFASEDIGNANPQALTLTTSAMTSVSRIGYPESRIILAQAVVYLCGSPKSNSSYKAINRALKYVRDGNILDIPKNIKQNHENYLNPHDFGGYVEQTYLTEEISFIKLLDVGYEKKMKDWLEKIGQIR